MPQFLYKVQQIWTANAVRVQLAVIHIW
jgi:hypothetical protein